MRAMVIPECGTPDVFELADLPVPSVGPGDVLIDVQYASVNFSDVRNRRGDGLGRPPMVVGIEVSGVVAALGSEVSGLAVGDPVASLCGGNGYAEKVAAPMERVVGLPESLVGDPVAACVTGVVPTAVNLLRCAGRVQPGEAMLVHGAAGGVGSSLGQLAKHLGLGPIYGTVGSASKIDYALHRGYDAVFVRDGFVDAVRAITHGRGVDVVFDPLGGATRADSWDALALFGRLVHFGNASLEPEEVPPAVDLRAGGFSYVGYSGGQHALADMPAVRESWIEGVQLVADGSVEVDVHRVFPLEEVAAAHRLLESGEAVGKLVLSIAGEVGPDV